MLFALDFEMSMQYHRLAATIEHETSRTAGIVTKAFLIEEF